MSQERRSHLLRGTAGQLIGLLRRKPRTVNELAEALRLTDNAVRAQLQKLERAGLAAASGVRPGLRKPHVEYALTPDASSLFAWSAEPLLQQLMAVLGKRLPSPVLDRMLKTVGRRLAGSFAKVGPRASLLERAHRAIEVLAELGGSVDLHQHDGKYTIEGHGCPMAAAVSAYPGTCCVAESLLSSVIGAAVRQHCDRTAGPCCRFEISAAKPAD